MSTDWDGLEYRQVSGMQQWLAERALAGVGLDGVRSVLDIGCGDGRITTTLAARIPGARVVGVDPSPGMIAAAPATSAVEFRIGDVLDERFSAEFDLVVSFNALHWVLDTARALRSIASALQPGGRALLVLVCAGERPSLEDVAMRVTAGPPWRDQFAAFQRPYEHPQPQRWNELAEAAGLQEVTTRVEDLTWDFGDRQSMARWCAAGFGAWTALLPSAQKQAFVDDVVDAYAEVAGSDQLLRFMQLRSLLQRREAGAATG
ncbi:MAG TPA: class I SAM-dependent methyltransferase [Frankiaceae bacterium]|nr:class I SAM-dependent methyltransferase [Frankiaceae bacterium]